APAAGRAAQLPERRRPRSPSSSAAKLGDRRTSAGVAVQPFPQRTGCLDVAPVVIEQPSPGLLGRLRPGRVDRGVVLYDGHIAPWIGDLPAEPVQRRDRLK